MPGAFIRLDGRRQPYAYLISQMVRPGRRGGKAPGYYERGTDAVERDAHLALVLDGLDPRSTKLGEVLRKEGDTVGYLYGGGEDAFEHTITLVSIVDDENKGVVVVSGVGGCPDEAGGLKYELPGASLGSTDGVRVATLCGAARRFTTALPRLHKWRLAGGRSCPPRC